MKCDFFYLQVFCLQDLQDFLMCKDNQMNLIKKSALQSKSKFKEQDSNNSKSKANPLKDVYSAAEYNNKNDKNENTLLTNNHNQLNKGDNNTTRAKSVRQNTSTGNRKIFRTVKMKTKLDFHNIKNINKTKNDFVNNVDRYSNSIIEGNNPTQGNNYLFNKSHKCTGSFIKAQMSGSSSHKKVKLYLDTTTTTSSFVLTDNNCNNTNITNMNANLKSKLRGTNAVKASSFLRSEGKLPSIDKPQNK